MSFLRHEQIYRPMRYKRGSRDAAPLSSFDESATGYSSASCTPALLASASPIECNGAPNSRNSSTTTQPGLGNLHPAKWGIFVRALTRATCYFAKLSLVLNFRQRPKSPINFQRVSRAPSNSAVEGSQNAQGGAAVAMIPPHDLCRSR